MLLLWSMGICKLAGPADLLICIFQVAAGAYMLHLADHFCQVLITTLAAYGAQTRQLGKAATANGNPVNALMAQCANLFL